MTTEREKEPQKESLHAEASWEDFKEEGSFAGKGKGSIFDLLPETGAGPEDDEQLRRETPGV